MTVALGLIGIGGLGYLQAKEVRELETVSIVAGADIAQEARKLFSDEFGYPVYSEYRQLLQQHGEELDAVSIVTPHTLHYDQALASLQRGIHVLVEKPMVTDVGHARDLVETANDRGLVLQVGYQRHFDPVFEELRRHIVNGRIGRLHTVNCYIGQDWIEANSGTWRVDPRLSGGGQLYDTGSHLIDVLLWVTDAQPVSVTAQVEYAEPQVDVNSASTIGLQREDNQILASVGISGDGTDVTPSEGYVFFGTDGRLSYTDGVIELVEQNGATYHTEVDGGSGFKRLNREKIQNFAASIEGRAEPAVPGRVGFDVTAVTEAVYHAAESGTEVSVQSLGGNPENV
jgi:predicted dehydrogenase